MLKSIVNMVGIEILKELHIPVVTENILRRLDQADIWYNSTWRALGQISIDTPIKDGKLNFVPNSWPYCDYMHESWTNSVGSQKLDEVSGIQIIDFHHLETANIQIIPELNAVDMNSLFSDHAVMKGEHTITYKLSHEHTGLVAQRDSILLGFEYQMVSRLLAGFEIKEDHITPVVLNNYDTPEKIHLIRNLLKGNLYSVIGPTIKLPKGS